MSTRRLLTVEMIVLVLPCTILWVMTAPPMGLVLIKTGPGGSGSWLPLWLGGGLFGLIALWSAHFDRVSDPRARLQPWQWVGLATGITTALSLVVPSLVKMPAFPLPPVMQVVIALPVIAAIRVVERLADASSPELNVQTES